VFRLIIAPRSHYDKNSLTARINHAAAIELHSLVALVRFLGRSNLSTLRNQPTYSVDGGYVFTSVCLSVCLSVRRITEQESYAISKMTAQCALHMGALKIFGTP